MGWLGASFRKVRLGKFAVRTLVRTAATNANVLFLTFGVVTPTCSKSDFAGTSAGIRQQCYDLEHGWKNVVYACRTNSLLICYSFLHLVLLHPRQHLLPRSKRPPDIDNSIGYRLHRVEPYRKPVRGNCFPRARICQIVFSIC